jgi:hypothetical protein
VLLAVVETLSKYPYRFFAQEPPTTSRLADGVDGLSAQRILTSKTDLCSLIAPIGNV